MPYSFGFIAFVICIVHHATVTVVITNIFRRHEDELKLTIFDINITAENDIRVVIKGNCLFKFFTLGVIVTRCELLHFIIYNDMYFAVKPVH